MARTALAGATFAAISLPRLSEAKRAPAGGRLVDTNVTLMQWPMRRLPLDESEVLARTLLEHHVVEAWACSFEALLQPDLTAVNNRLARACKSAPRNLFIPFGAINPARTRWREDLRRCADEHKMPGIRLYPNYHGYTLNDAACADLFAECAGRGLIVQIAATLEDVRVQHPRMKCDPVDLKPLPGALAHAPGLKLVLLNWNRALNSKIALSLAAEGKAWVDMATQEGVAGISNLLRQAPRNAVLFGSHAPFYYFESALLKLRESELTADELEAIRFGNAGNVKRTHSI